MNKLQRRLNELEQRAARMSSFEANYEHDAANHYEHADKAQAPIMNPSGSILKAPSGYGGTGRVDAAQFDLNVTRINTNFNGVLPYALFAPMHARQAYANFITPPAGWSLVVMGGSDWNGGVGNAAALGIYALNTDIVIPDAIRQVLNTSLVFAYIKNDDVTKIDYVVVSCNQVAYNAFLAANMVDVFNMSKIRYQISDSAQTVQFQQKLVVTSESIFGKLDRQSLSVGAYKSPGQFQTDIIDVNGSFDSDKETALVSNIIKVNNFTSTFSIFVSRFDKHNRLEMGQK